MFQLDASMAGSWLERRQAELMDLKRRMAEAVEARAAALAAGEDDWVETPSADEEQEVCIHGA